MLCIDQIHYCTQQPALAAYFRDQFLIMVHREQIFTCFLVVSTILVNYRTILNIKWSNFVPMILKSSLQRKQIITLSNECRYIAYYIHTVNVIGSIDDASCKGLLKNGKCSGASCHDWKPDGCDLKIYGKE